MFLRRINKSRIVGRTSWVVIISCVNDVLPHAIFKRILGWISCCSQLSWNQQGKKVTGELSKNLLNLLAFSYWNASAGNRTRATSMATRYCTIQPQKLFNRFSMLLHIRRNSHLISICICFLWVNILPTRLEPVTLGLLDLRSNQLSYRSLKNMLSVLA